MKRIEITLFVESSDDAADILSNTVEDLLREGCEEASRINSDGEGFRLRVSG